jgi:hypothetical protein
MEDLWKNMGRWRLKFEFFSSDFENPTGPGTKNVYLFHQKIRIFAHFSQKICCNWGYTFSSPTYPLPKLTETRNIFGPGQANRFLISLRHNSILGLVKPHYLQKNFFIGNKCKLSTSLYQWKPWFITGIHPRINYSLFPFRRRLVSPSHIPNQWLTVE